MGFMHSVKAAYWPSDSSLSLSVPIDKLSSPALLNRAMLEQRHALFSQTEQKRVYSRNDWSEEYA